MRIPITLRWWWHIPASSGSDVCSCHLDGHKAKPLTEITGETAWKQESAVIPAGLHEISWRWKTDDSGDPLEEASIVDQVSLTP